MIDRYSLPEMREIWTLHSKFNYYLKVELAVCEAYAKLGKIPQEDLVVSDPIQQGDTVFHAKYGSGIVEKMIKYGNKTLFSINFDNIGRRLLDPTLTEIKKS